MVQNKIKWGIIGLGNIASKFAQDLLMVDNAILQAVASRDLEKSKSFSEKYNSKEYYGNYEELVKDPNIDIVYIATPHVFHFENTMLCLTNDKAVLCEKPFAINENEVNLMIDTAKSRNLFLMEAMWTRLIPGIQKVIDIIETGDIGKIKTIEANFGFIGNRLLPGRLFNRDLGGGSLMDIGIYPIYLSLLLLGTPFKIEAKAEMFNGVDSSCKVKFIYKNGQTANLFSTLNEVTSTEAMIYGEEGSIRIHKDFHHPNKITVCKESSEKTFSIEYKGNGYYHEIVETNNCLIKNELQSSKMPFSKSLELIQTLDKIRKIINLSYLNDTRFN